MAGGKGFLSQDTQWLEGWGFLSQDPQWPEGWGFSCSKWAELQVVEEVRLWGHSSLPFALGHAYAQVLGVAGGFKMKAQIMVCLRKSPILGTLFKAGIQTVMRKGFLDFS